MYRFSASNGADTALVVESSRPFCLVARSEWNYKLLSTALITTYALHCSQRPAGLLLCDVSMFVTEMQ
jgi:hypothetical protein